MSPMVQNRMIGRRYDGGRSPLGGPVGLPEFDESVMLAVPEPDSSGIGGVVHRDPHHPVSLTAPGRWTKEAHEDWERVGRGVPPAVGAYVDRKLREWGCDPRGLHLLGPKKRRKLQNRIRSEIVRLQEEDRQLLARQVELEAMREQLTGRGGYVPGGRIETLDHDVAHRGGIPKDLGRSAREEYRQARTRLHLRLRSEWAGGPLVLDRPQGSSLHHMLDYDEAGAEQSERHAQWRRELESCQIVLVENDWGAAVPQIEGEWRVPFAFMCWEFRISGVRVLAFTEADCEPSIMWCCYGADGHWVADDYRYELGCSSLPPGVEYHGDRRRDVHEFRRVAKMCYDTIRASCIMLDAQVARHEHVAASSKLAERRVREGRAPLRDHYVVRLLHEERRSFHRARSAGGSIAGTARAAQRGHWRKGTWVHFDDQDSGQVQYVNDGGFVVSKTWRRWHFAGDPKNIIHKEYRL